MPVMVLRPFDVEGGDGARDGHVTYHVEASRRTSGGRLAAASGPNRPQHAGRAGRWSSRVGHPDGSAGGDGLGGRHPARLGPASERTGRAGQDLEPGRAVPDPDSAQTGLVEDHIAVRGGLRPAVAFQLEAEYKII